MADELKLPTPRQFYRLRAERAEAMVVVAEKLCGIYFEIAAAAIGADHVRKLRDKALEDK